MMPITEPLRAPSSARLPTVESSPQAVTGFRTMSARDGSARSRRMGTRFRLDSAMSKSTVGGSQQHLLAIDPFNTFKVDDLTNYSMDDQRWTLQRKKIGLKRRTKGTRARRVRDIRTRDINLAFVRSHFTRKECVKYCQDPSRNGRKICYCGLAECDHLSADRLFNPVSRPHTQSTSRLETFQEEGEEVEEEIMMGDMNSMTSSIMGILGINGTPWGQPPSAPLAARGSIDAKSITSDVESGNDRRLPEVITNASGITPRIQSRVYPTDQAPAPTAFLEPKLSIPPAGAKWDSSTHLQELPTNAYGTIDFINETTGSNKPAKYVRLSDSTNIQSVLTLLTDYWRMMEPQRPQLVISVTGGADFLNLDGRKREIFSSGLMKAVKSTGAWILTGGLHVGVNRIVGEAVNESQYIVKVKRKELFSETQDYLARGIRCIGVLPWGYTRDKHLLLNTDLNEFAQVRYKVQERTSFEDPVSLDGDHTHFLMVDDGTRDQFNGTVNFRTRLEEAIQAEEPSGLGIPVVVVLLEGGLGALGKCAMALKKNIPVVVVGGTGRAADLLAYAVAMTVRTASGRYILRRQYVTQLMNKILAAMTELQGKTDKQKKCADYVLECCARANMIITFDIECGEGLDHCILYALLTGGAQSSRLEQLSLALLWDRPDIAEYHIFPAESNWASWDLKDLMTTALLEEKVEFVKLFILNGLVMSDYLNVTTLRYLYNEACKSESHTHLRRLLQRSSRSNYHYLVHVHNILQAMLRKHHDPVYLSDTPQAVMMDSSINYLTFADPYQELLLWAIFSRRGNLARFLWERSETPLCAAVVASCVYQSLWKSLGAKNTVILNEYQKQKIMFETLAVELQDVCYQEDPPNAMGLVERRNPKWGQMDCLELAHLANDLMFIATPCSQASVELNWRRGLTRAPPLAVTLCNFLPFLVWTKLFGFQKLGDNGGELTPWQKLVVFYKSPISKFFAHSTSFVVFLLLYAYVILFDFKYEMSVAETLVICWVFTFIVGEMSEIASEQSTSLRGKVSDWLNSVWNRFDLMAIILTLLALGLRLHRNTFKWGRIAYSLNTTLFYCRLFRIYHVNYHLGPKLVIFYRMISEVLVFMALLVIFILGYGIASQGLLYPGRDVSTLNATDVGQIMREVLLTPYWQMYGELLLDDIKGGDVETCYEESCTVPESCVSEGRNCVRDCVCENASEYTWAVNLMLFIYLIIGNIMLLNLLIAIFTYVFDEVQENSMEIWKFEMYRLIREYDSKPALVPPFVVFEYVWRITKAIWKVTCRRKKENLEDYMKDTLTSLRIFEKESIQTYLSRVTAAEEEQLGNRVRKINEKIDKVSKYIEQREEIEDMEDDFEWMTQDEEQSPWYGHDPHAMTSQQRMPQSSVDARSPMPPPPTTLPPIRPLASVKKGPKSVASRRKKKRPNDKSRRADKIIEEDEEDAEIEEARTVNKESGREEEEEDDDDEEEVLDEAEMSLRGPLDVKEDVEEEGISAKDIEKELVQLKKQQASERQGRESRPHTSHGNSRRPAAGRVTTRLDELQATQIKMIEDIQEILRKIRLSEAKERAKEDEEGRRRREEKERRDREREDENERRRKKEQEEEEEASLFVKSQVGLKGAKVENEEEEEEEEEILPILKPIKSKTKTQYRKRK